ncbi:MAG: 2-C-methyl-D-erythritol 4-phosphate cytidylyltransferase [Candidatus Bipolaricaulota bacterium]|nr:MAG: 2-C-methyl-D-erythritol 4-phosphate cytidylyltransferase [Candidatus Bipolaricaulota bacterium]
MIASAAVTAVVLAAGRGQRMASDRPKLLLPIAGRPLLAFSVEAFAACPEVDEIVLVTPADEPLAAAIECAVCRHVPAAEIRFVPGGATRRASSLAGVRAATGAIVLVHDGARPCVTTHLVTRVIEGTRMAGACVPVVTPHDTLRIVEGGLLAAGSAVRGRDRVAVQTPQGFVRERIVDALAVADEDLPDDAEALLRRGESVSMIEGERENVKLTMREDLSLIAAILSARRAGAAAPGFDPSSAPR